jgi:pimeloyl-ACP methyl ester carboxylesterase
VAFAAFYPYRSAAARDRYLSFYDDLAAKEWPLASEIRMVPTSFGRTFVRVSGPEDARALVLLPGGGASSLMWSSNVAALSDHHRTYAVDRIGDVGRSVARRAIAGREDLTVWLDELVRGLEIPRPFDLMGMSHGGWLTAEYALQFPESVRRAVLLAPAATVQRLSVGFLWRGALSATGSRFFVRLFVRWLFADLARENPRRFAVTLESTLMTVRCLQPWHILPPRVLPDRELGRLAMPVLFVLGEHERIYSAGKAKKRLARVAPRIRFATVAGAGHDMTAVAADTVNRTIVDFLAAR